MSEPSTSLTSSSKVVAQILANLISCFLPLDEGDSTHAQDELVPNAAVKSKAPQSKVSSAPRARFAMLNAFNASNVQVAPTAPVVPKKQEKPTQEPVVRKTKLDMLAEKYRDRADERRKRGPEDDEEDEEIADADALRERRERSKYLGGSEDTTHLVEGLDILLYERRKLEIELEEKRQKEEAARATEPVLLGAKHLVIDRHGHAKAVDAPQEFRTALGKGVYNALFQREAPPPIESFLPDRTAYIFPLDLSSALELPTIIERNMLADSETSGERDFRTEPFSAATSANALSKLSIVMSYLNQGESGLKRRRQELKDRETKAKAVVTETLQKLSGTAPKAEAPVIDEDDEDIFGDVAAKEYTPTVHHVKESEPKTFEGTIWDKVRGADAQRGDSNDGRQPGDLSAKRAREEKKQGQEGDEQEEPSDDYDGFESGSDEENITFMDTDLRLKRNDFTNEDDFRAYEANREVIPKAAFSFGVKKADTKRTKKSTLKKNIRSKVTGAKQFAPK